MQDLNELIPAVKDALRGDRFHDLLPPYRLDVDALHLFGVDVGFNDFDVMEDKYLSIVGATGQLLFLLIVVFFLVPEKLFNFCMKDILLGLRNSTLDWASIKDRNVTSSLIFHIFLILSSSPSSPRERYLS